MDAVVKGLDVEELIVHYGTISRNQSSDTSSSITTVPAKFVEQKKLDGTGGRDQPGAPLRSTPRCSSSSSIRYSKPT